MAVAKLTSLRPASESYRSRFWDQRLEAKSNNRSFWRWYERVFEIK